VQTSWKATKDTKIPVIRMSTWKMLPSCAGSNTYKCHAVSPIKARVDELSPDKGITLLTTKHLSLMEISTIKLSSETLSGIDHKTT
jgi:hypothetical protein